MKFIQNAFRLCLVFSVVGVFATVIIFSLRTTSTSALVYRTLAFFIVGLPPIYVYYKIISSHIKKHGTAGIDSSIDSVYYLGFLITLTTLLASVISYGFVGFGGTKNAAATVIFIAMGFGLSLTATAFALWARVDLVQQRDLTVAEHDPEDVLDNNLFKLEESSRRLSTVLADASLRFEDSLRATNSTTAQQVVGIIDDARTSLNDFVRSASAEVSASQQAMAESTARGVQTMSDNIAELHGRMVGVIEEARTNLKEFVKSAALKSSSSAISKAVADVTASLVKASGDLSSLFASLEALQSRSSGVVGDLDSLSASVRRASDSTGTMKEALHRISDSTTSLNLEPLLTGLSQLGERLQTLGASAGTAENRYAAASDAAVNSMRSKTDDLTEATRHLSDAFVAVAEELGRSTSFLSDRLK